MSAETWQMPSGRTATIDLAQGEQAVEQARQLLRDVGATPAHEDAPAPAATGDEGQTPTRGINA